MMEGKGLWPIATEAILLTRCGSSTLCHYHSTRTHRLRFYLSREMSGMIPSYLKSHGCGPGLPFPITRPINTSLIQCRICECSINGISKSITRRVVRCIDWRLRLGSAMDLAPQHLLCLSRLHLRFLYHCF